MDDGSWIKGYLFSFRLGSTFAWPLSKRDSVELSAYVSSPGLFLYTVFDQFVLRVCLRLHEVSNRKNKETQRSSVPVEQDV